MQKFLIEVDHPGDTYACAQVIKLFLESGSHFLVNAEWGAWMTCTNHGSSWKRTTELKR